MDPVESTSGPTRVEAQVRANAGPAGLVAGLLIFFGFFWFGGAVGTTLFVNADLLFRTTLCLGGLAMVGVAIWSSVGAVPALLADAIVRVVIGVLLVISAVLMLAAAGLALNPCIYIVCGAILVTYGLRAWREYRHLAARQKADSRELEALEAYEETASQDVGLLLRGHPGTTPKTAGRAARKQVTPRTSAGDCLTSTSKKRSPRKP